MSSRKHSKNCALPFLKKLTFFKNKTMGNDNEDLLGL